MDIIEIASPPTAAPPPTAEQSVRRGRGRRVAGLLAAAAPTVAFVVADEVSSLRPAIACAGAVAMAVFGWRLLTRQPVRQATLGLGVVAVCATVAAVTGQARGFFLVPALIPFAVIAVCVATLVVGKPLTGLVLNRVAGGPRDWRDVPRLRRVYVVSTIAAAAVNVANAAVQVVFYLADKPVVLAAAHVATGPAFAVLVAVTVAAVRRVLAHPETTTGQTAHR